MCCVTAESSMCVALPGNRVHIIGLDDCCGVKHTQRHNCTLITRGLTMDTCVWALDVNLRGKTRGVASGRLTWSIAGEAFCVVASPRNSLIDKLDAAFLRVLLSGSDRQLMVRCSVAMYC